MEQQNEQQQEATGENTGRRRRAQAEAPAGENQKQTRRRREVAENFTPPADSGVAADGSRKLAYTDDLGKKVQALASNITNKRKEREAINVEISKDFKVAKALGISKRALENGIKRIELNEAERNGMDLEQTIVYRALGVQMKLDLTVH